MGVGVASSNIEKTQRRIPGSCSGKISRDIWNFSDTWNNSYKARPSGRLWARNKSSFKKKLIEQVSGRSMDIIMLSVVSQAQS